MEYRTQEALLELFDTQFVLAYTKILKAADQVTSASERQIQVAAVLGHTIVNPRWAFDCGVDKVFV